MEESFCVESCFTPCSPVVVVSVLFRNVITSLSLDVIDWLHFVIVALPELLIE